MGKKAHQMRMLLARVHGRQRCLPNVDRTAQKKLGKAGDQIIPNEGIVELVVSAMRLDASQSRDVTYNDRSRLDIFGKIKPSCVIS